MTDASLAQAVGTALLVASAVLGLFLAAVGLIAANLGADGRLNEASAVGRAGDSPPAVIGGTDARALLRRTEL